MSSCGRLTRKTQVNLTQLATSANALIQPVSRRGFRIPVVSWTTRLDKGVEDIPWAHLAESHHTKKQKDFVSSGCVVGFARNLKI